MPLPLSVRVPASTSNLGPGFDALGLAVDLFLDVELLGASGDAAHRYELAGGGGPFDATASWSGVEGENTLGRALDLGRSRWGGPPGGLAFRVRSEIPLGRGLGSSAAAAVAGLLLAAARAPRPVAEDEVLELAVALEGHPDNAAPALKGGLCLAVPSARGTLCVARELHADVGVALAWPATPVATARARAALPRDVPLADAVENARRLALLLAGLEAGAPSWIAAGLEDRLHVRHRLPLIPGGPAALEAARGAGAWAATVSGSGSALLALAPRERAQDVAAAMAAALERADGWSRGRAVEPVRRPTRAGPAS